MPLAITLPLAGHANARVRVLWRRLARAGVDDDRLRLHYAPHVTLAVFGADAPEAAVVALAARLAPHLRPQPLHIAGCGLFAAGTGRHVLTLAPAPTAALLELHARLSGLAGDLLVHPHYRTGRWVPHVTLTGALADPDRAIAALGPWRPFEARLAGLHAMRFRPARILWRMPGPPRQAPQ